MNQVRIAVNICTYRREQYLKRNISKLMDSDFFNEESSYFNGLEIFVIDNASELSLDTNEFVHLIHNKNNGGSGGFQRGIEEIRKCDNDFTHVIFMDDDVDFDISAFYILYDFLCNVDETNKDRPVAGRMLDEANRDIQWTAAEIWNRGNIEHVEFLRNIQDSSNPYVPGKVIYNAGAQYGGWWFCCYPMSFVKDNDVLPFFLHCDDVEYGLRCGKSPIIIEGVHVWHALADKKFSHTMLYYDVRNAHLVNEMYGLLPPMEEVIANWKKLITDYHLEENWLYEYAAIKGMNDFLKGIDWMKSIDPEKNHKRLQKMRSNKLKNAIAWRLVERKLRKRNET